MWPDRVRIVEVGPRDGLQNEAGVVSIPTRIRMIELLACAGLRHIEVGSFVSEKAVPRMAGTAEVLKALRLPETVRLSVLVPNLRGLDAAVAAGAPEIAIFAAASESFSRANLGCGVEESLVRLANVASAATRNALPLRGYVSCALGCPYEGRIDPARVIDVARRLFDLGCCEISLADTIGVGTPRDARHLLQETARVLPVERLAVHFHDTYGQALANIFACLDVGVSIVDSSIAGLGGCPFAPGATGNVATEDVVYMLQGCGVETGVDLGRLLEASRYICDKLGRPPESRVARARLRVADLPPARGATGCL